jgi:hypothetical protein
MYISTIQKRDIDRPRRRWRETQQHYRSEQEILLIQEVMMMMMNNCYKVTTLDEKIKFLDKLRGGMRGEAVGLTFL